MDKKVIIETLESSPFWSLLGLKVNKMEHGEAEIYLPVKKELGQVFSVMHGGATASLLDAAGAVSLFDQIDFENEAVTTVELKINYLNPVTLNENKITASARVIKKGRSIAVCLVEIHNDKGGKIALGIATYAIVKRIKSENPS